MCNLESNEPILDLTIEENLFKADMQLLDKYQSFSKQMLRIAVSGITLIGFFIANSGGPNSIIKLNEYSSHLFFISAIILTLSTLFSLGHLYYSTDSMAHFIRYIRKNDPIDHKSMVTNFSLSKVLIFLSAVSLFIAIAIAVCGITQLSKFF